MINYLIKNNKLNEVKTNLIVTYPRTVEIICGHYPYPHIVHNFILDIKNNLDPNKNNYTNVKGGMTDWNHYLDNDNFKGFIAYLINTHQTTSPQIFKYFLERYEIINAWGNEIKLNDSLNYHRHICWHGILYLTKGCDLILPELNIRITPEPGDYYIFPPDILHGFDESPEESNRYSLIFNLTENNRVFDFTKKLEEKSDRENSKHK